MDRMRLITNFGDYYDAWFGTDGPEFRRRSDEGLSKPDQFRLMADAGFRTPPHGLFGDIANSWWEEEGRRVSFLVVYDDLFAHAGEGKRLVQSCWARWDGCINRIQQSRERSSMFCSAYVGNGFNPNPCTWRLLQVGRHRFWIEYRSNDQDQWRSNCGDVTCEVLSVELDHGVVTPIPYPLWAIDFAIGKELYAIDFNNAPGIRGSGVERHLPPKRAAEAIEEAYARLVQA